LVKKKRGPPKPELKCACDFDNLYMQINITEGKKNSVSFLVKSFSKNTLCIYSVQVGVNENSSVQFNISSNGTLWVAVSSTQFFNTTEDVQKVGQITGFVPMGWYARLDSAGSLLGSTLLAQEVYM
jgi:hypothetical protein